MSKFKCNCGEVLDLSVSPAPQEFCLTPERIIDSIVDFFEKNTFDAEVFYSKLNENLRDVICCDKCSRIWVEDTPGKFSSYQRESRT